MRPRWIVLLGVIAMIAPLVGGRLVPRSRAQEPPQVVGKVERQALRVKIALPGAQAEGEAAEIARQILGIVRDDLEFSGYFDIVEPELYRLVSNSPPGDVPYEEWQSIGADTVALTQLNIRHDERGKSVDLLAWYYDAKAAGLNYSRRYSGGLGLLRRVAHRFANDLIEQHTGAGRGIALTRIAFVSEHDDAKEIYLMDYDGQNIRRLTTSGTVNLAPTWSPDGTRLAYLSWRENRPDVYVMTSEGERFAVPIMKAELNAAPDWSPDGDKIVYSSDAPGNSELFVVDLKRRTNARLTRNPAIETAPTFSPTGREIAFTSDRSGTPQIYIMDAEGLNTRRVSRESSYNDSAAWAPSGDRLAYVSRIAGRFEIVVLNLGSGQLTQLTGGPGNKENPRWSPDGRHLVFSSNPDGVYSIYTIRSDGTGLRRLTRGAGSYTPDWSR